MRDAKTAFSTAIASGGPAINVAAMSPILIRPPDVATYFAPYWFTPPEPLNSFLAKLASEVTAEGTFAWTPSTE